MEEWDLYTKDRIKTGETVVKGQKIKEGRYRMVVHICIFNSKGQMLIQQRQSLKPSWPDMWDLSVGGHVIAGETSSEAAEREVMEEIGLKIKLDRPELTVHFENGFDDIYVVYLDVDIDKLKLQEEEVKAVKWATLQQINAMIDDAVFIPYQKEYIELLFVMKQNKGAHQKNG